MRFGTSAVNRDPQNGGRLGMRYLSSEQTWVRTLASYARTEKPRSVQPEIGISKDLERC